MLQVPLNLIMRSTLRFDGARKCIQLIEEDPYFATVYTEGISVDSRQKTRPFLSQFFSNTNIIFLEFRV